jgi:hypothetical protein
MSKEPQREHYDTDEEYEKQLGAYEDYADAKYEDSKDE